MVGEVPAACFGTFTWAVSAILLLAAALKGQKYQLRSRLLSLMTRYASVLSKDTADVQSEPE